ncbi:ATP-binding protein [Pedobacter montanisoli]|uniref:histidine kinase n=1 Tax=Pedobacter montanisoli TaxID=2923277 RepID=A0ABS9ZYM3_9SPHI|nr:ATP-binding protein [Pedobacter montanisoli]MCJ0743413.1 ATP-binding protein [Pedobacter montanisoli]
MKNFKIRRIESASYVQSFGYIIVIDLEGQIIGLSSNISEISTEPVNSYLKQPIAAFFNRSFAAQAPKILKAIQKLLDEPEGRQTLYHHIAGKRYYLNLFRNKDKIYCEWEPHQKRAAKTVQIDTLTCLLEEKTKNVWTSVCTSVRKIIGFDRVLIFKMEASGRGRMLSECSADKKYLGKQFAESFMPAEAINFYRSSPYRYCPDTDNENIAFLEIGEPTDLSPSLLHPFPDVHINYLKGIGVVSVIVIPIFIDHKFWGLLAGHHYQEKAVDLQTRQLCTLVLQHAAHRFDSDFKRSQLKYYNQIKSIEFNLKEKLMNNNSINVVLVQNLKMLCRNAKADGIAIYHAGDIFTSGICPTHAQIEEIVKIINPFHKKPIFKDHDFASKYRKEIGSLSFAGLLSLQIAQRNDHYILWFRKEKTDRMYRISSSNAQEEEAGCETWEETIVNAAEPWDDKILYFVQSLNELLHEVIVLRSKEHEKLNEELILLNNEFETIAFTLSHDLKNPLSVVKIGAQIIHDQHLVQPQNNKQNWSKTILDGIQNIEAIIEGLLHLLDKKAYKFSKAPIPLSHMLKKIVDETKILYNNERCTVEFGKLLPIWGEKSMIYQIFLNVISNAVKYTSMQEQPFIKIDSHQNNKYLHYSITDNGIGIPKAFLKNMFNVFNRASNSHDFPGTGIGLSLTKRMLEKLDGKIAIKSAIGNGTTVILSFPYAPQNLLSINRSSRS